MIKTRWTLLTASPAVSPFHQSLLNLKAVFKRTRKDVKPAWGLTWGDKTEAQTILKIRAGAVGPKNVTQVPELNCYFNHHIPLRCILPTVGTQIKRYPTAKNDLGLQKVEETFHADKHLLTLPMVSGNCSVFLQKGTAWVKSTFSIYFFYCFNLRLKERTES